MSKPHTDAAQDERALQAHPEVRIAEGLVRGRWRPTTGERGNGRSAAFLGIPFAEAPVGELRFGEPQPKAPWGGVLDAAEFGATAQRGDPGVTLIPEPSIPGDSTLNVNVFTPTLEPASAGAGLPVLVWIHGGGYFAGSPASVWYDGRNFNRDGVVTVTVSYRLGFDGFGGIGEAPSNRGVRDWLLALEWVQRNIAAFGGDPARVTIAGQSAGGGAVMTLLGMECAQHLFQGVYAISGALADVSAERSEAFGRKLAESAGVAPTRAGWSAVPEDRVLELQKAATAMTPDSMSEIIDEGLPLGPTVDGELLLRPTAESFRLGVGAGKPLVLGATDDEFSMAMTDAAKALRWVPKGILLGKLGVPKAARGAYLAANPDVVAAGKARLAGRVLTDRMFRTAILRIAEARGFAPTWVYRFAWPSGTFGFAEHCLDVPFFFDCLDGPAMEPLAGPNPPQALADEVHAAAVAFIADGDPGWPMYDGSGRIARVFDTPSRDARDAYAAVRPLL
ncbi:carboxylesterase [Leucobacter sp. OLJS4]|uniref:carboxylesterase/lipase family protein n=1 Tax=unclassified Leucobacter TaxID=2621730 RepID=UPI000C174F71|nr:MULTISPECIES: carboxylesterase family protein [unclassified Leucobacter]PIJ47734.1 carboxylesterase [Leucobacter sp. OLES1]PII83399.1 carboxylesterase [Leucobacter sp. OLCALW19]PII86949.1 carboxylesterase [Leucobacter sp. OLTLW20]PII89211.1 carboxylesterase [Leucobacter sp. OLAS13]PII99421.1 carboxylesterase [Leucobacter sp. OLDS2]